MLFRSDLKPLPGGDSVFMQQQNWSLEQLDKRDIINDKPAVAPPPDEPEPAESDAESDAEELEDTAKAFLEKELGYVETA